MKKLFIAFLFVLFAVSAEAAISSQGSGISGYQNHNAMQVTPSRSCTSGQLCYLLGYLTPAYRIVTGTTDTILSTDNNTTIFAQSATGTAFSLSAATATGFTNGFAFNINNQGSGNSIITTTSSINDSYSPFTVKQGDGCWFIPNGSKYEIDATGCPAKDYNAVVGSGTMTMTLPTVLAYTNASSFVRRYKDVTTGLLATATGSTSTRFETGGLLVEQTATNLYSQSPSGSSSFTNNTGGVVSTATGITGPGGTAITVGKCTEDTATSGHSCISQSVALTSGETYTYSLEIILDGSATSFQIAPAGTGWGTGKHASFNNLGETATSAGLIESGSQVFSNGTMRVWVTATAVATANGSMALAFNDNTPVSARVPSYLGTGKYIYFTGANVTKGRVSSYIPSGGGTRLADKLVLADGMKYKVNSIEGWACGAMSVTDNTSGAILVGDETNATPVAGITAGGNLSYGDGTNTTDSGLALPTAGTKFRFCTTWGGDTMLGSLNGVLGASGTFDGNMGLTNPQVLKTQDGHVDEFNYGIKKLSASDLTRMSATP